MKEFILYFFGEFDSKGRSYFPAKPCTFILMLSLIFGVVSLFMFPSLSILLFSISVATIINSYISFRVYKFKNMTTKEKRENKIKNLLSYERK